MTETHDSHHDRAAVLGNCIRETCFSFSKCPGQDLRTYSVYRRVATYAEMGIVCRYCMGHMSYTDRNESTHVCLTGIARCVQQKSEITNN
jgi:hypothetical protein